MLLLLHRTGGSENDLLEFGDRISRGGALLAPRGPAGALPELLRAAGARVEHAFVDADHTLTGEDSALATEWLDRLAAG